MNYKIRVFVGGVLAAAGFAVHSAETTTTEDMTAAGDWEVMVAAGDTNTVSVMQSGSGKIVKKGAGTLVLAVQNSFTGGITLEAGVVSAGASGCLGTGEITILGQREGYTGACGLWFSGSDADFGSPPIHVTGETSCQYPALCLVGTNNVFSGDITADHSLYFRDDYQWLYNEIKKANGSAKWSTNVSAYNSAHFYGTIAVADTFHHVPDTICHFHGSVRARIFDTVKQANEYRQHNESDQTYYAAIYFYAPNQFEVLNYGYRHLYFRSDQGFAGARVTSNIPGVTYPRPGNLYLCGHDVTIAGLDLPRVKSDDWTASRGGVSSVEGNDPATLTITGTTAQATCQSGMRWLSNLDVLLDATENPGFTQEITWRQQSTSGTITLRNGTLRLSGDAYFSSSAAKIVVEENGVLELVGTNMPLGKISALEVRGRLHVGAGVTDVFAAGNATKLKLYSGCVLESDDPVTVAANTLWMDDVQMMKGRRTAADFPEGMLDGQIVVTAVTGDPQAPTTQAEWTGAAETDDLSSTLANWRVGGEVPAALNFSNGMLGVTIGTAATATNLVPAEGVLHLNSIVFDRPTNSMCGPFFLGAPGRTIVLDGALMPPSEQRAAMSQLVLRGTITSPYGDQGNAESNGKYTIYYREAARPSAQSPASSIYGYNSSYGTPLILDGATVNKPCFLYAKGPGGEAFHALPGTVNAFRQHVQLDAGGWLVISAGAGAEVTFEGGFKSGYRCVTRLNGTFRVVDKPIEFTTGLNLEGGTFILDAVDNVFGNTDTQNQGVRMGENAASRLVFQRSGCFKDNDKEQLNVIGSKQATLDFNVTTQRVSRFLGTNTHKSSVMTGAYPAMLEVKGGTAYGAAKYVWQTMENSVQIAGGLGVHYLGNGPASGKAGIAAGTSETFTLGSREFSSCGNLEVSGGTLELAADATWLNGTNFTARGTGVLKFAGSRQINGQIAVAHFADAGAFELEGRQHVASAEVLVDNEWQAVPNGCYTAESTGLMANRVKGTGRLRVGTVGTVLSIR